MKRQCGSLKQDRSLGDMPAGIALDILPLLLPLCCATYCDPAKQLNLCMSSICNESAAVLSCTLLFQCLSLKLQGHSGVQCYVAA